jgi:hypothetical protein
VTAPTAATRPTTSYPETARVGGGLYACTSPERSMCGVSS